MAVFPFYETHDLCSPKCCQVPVQTHLYICTQIHIYTQLISCTVKETGREKCPICFQVHVDVCMKATGEFHCPKHRCLKIFRVYFLNACILLEVWIIVSQKPIRCRKLMVCVSLYLRWTMLDPAEIKLVSPELLIEMEAGSCTTVTPV